MKAFESDKIRSLAVVGHGQTGKTSLVSAVLFNNGMVNRLGKVDQGNTVTDFDEDEIEKKITIQASVAYAVADKYKINLIDTPGFANFASVGIQLGGIGALAPNQRTTLSRYGMLSLVAGTFAALFSATIVGMIY